MGDEELFGEQLRAGPAGFNLFHTDGCLVFDRYRLCSHICAWFGTVLLGQMFVHAEDGGEHGHVDRTRCLAADLL